MPKLPAYFAQITPAHNGTGSVVIESSFLDDDRALAVFVDAYEFKSEHTQRAFRFECARFLLWVRARYQSENPSLLPLVTNEDTKDYVRFLHNPENFSEAFLNHFGWDHQPFRKPLGPKSLERATTILYGWFEAMRNMKNGDDPYCKFNSFLLGKKKKKNSKKGNVGSEKALSSKAIKFLFQAIEELPEKTERDRFHKARSRWMIQLFYRAWLRRDEVAHMTMGDFDIAKGIIRVAGKGRSEKEYDMISLTTRLKEELFRFRTAIGLPLVPPYQDQTPAIPRVINKRKHQRSLKHLSDDAIYHIVMELYAKAADLADAADLEKVGTQAYAELINATPHSLRHTGITHAKDGGAPDRWVQSQARHGSPATTSLYDKRGITDQTKVLEDAGM